MFHSSYSYFFFSFPYLNQLAEFVATGEFAVPAIHIDAINAAFDKHNSHVYFFISAQNSKLIHVCLMLEMHRRDYVKCEKERVVTRKCPIHSR